MTTLRDLANIPNASYTLDEWVRLARSCGIYVNVDAPLDRNQMMALQNKFKESLNGERKPPRSDSDKRAAAMRILEKMIQDNYIFVDLSSILAPAGQLAIEHMLPLLTQYKKKLYVPDSVVRLLKQKSMDMSNPEQARLCKERYDALYKMASSDLVQIRKFDNQNSTPAQDLLTACSHFRMKYSLLILTQDETLAGDLLSLNNQRSADGKSVTVKRINKYGFLSNVIESPREGGKSFRFSVIPRTGADSKLPMTVVPKNGDSVYNTASRSGEIILGEEIGSGGEGTIFRTNTPYVAKIYKPECCTAYRQEKIQKIISAGLSYKGICLPMSALYNQHGEFVGYLMPEAKGHSLQSSIFRKPMFLRKLPGWDKESLVQCAITILYKFKYLHDHGIIIGDINPNNILVVSPTEVYLVDTDSYQIEDLPCPVGFPLFTAPEIHQKHRNGEFSSYSEINRTKQNEYFAIATLIFMLLLPGKPPYTHAGGEDVVDNILQMHFPYALGEQRGVKVPDGTWRFLWSHLTRKMKENFHQIFSKGEDKSPYNIKERLNIDQWIVEMDGYKKTIQKWKDLLEQNRPRLESMRSEVERMRQHNDYRLEAAEEELSVFEASLPDPMSMALYPDRLKRMQNVVYVKCKGENCSREYAKDDDRMKAGYCPECQRKGETVKCMVCDEGFIFSNYEKYYKKYQRPNMCPECRKHKDETYIDEKCANPLCSKWVKLNRATYAHFRARGINPRLCPDCRNKLQTSNRPATPAPKPVSTQSTAPRPTAQKPPAYPPRTPTRSQPTPVKKSSGFKGCFITTAVCGYLGKPDDCQELTDFRNFRDNWLIHQPGGKEQISEYYECAPELVRRMTESSNYAQICTTLWEAYLVPCQQMIHTGQLNQCRAHYTAMVEYLRAAVNS